MIWSDYSGRWWVVCDVWYSKKEIGCGWDARPLTQSPAKRNACTQRKQRKHRKHQKTVTASTYKHVLILACVACVVLLAIMLRCVRCLRCVRRVKFYASTLRSVHCVWLETAPKARRYCAKWQSSPIRCHWSYWSIIVRCCGRDKGLTGWSRRQRSLLRAVMMMILVYRRRWIGCDFHRELIHGFDFRSIGFCVRLKFGKI